MVSSQRNAEAFKREGLAYLINRDCDSGDLLILGFSTSFLCGLYVNRIQPNSHEYQIH